MISGSLSRRYARALFEIGTDQGNYEQLGREVDELATTYAGSRELAEALGNPVFPMARRRAVLEAILQRAGVAPMTKNFALLLLDRERISELPGIARELRVLVDEKAGRVRATVTSATPLTADQESRVMASLQKISGKKVLLEKLQDPGLLGGVVAQLGDMVFDGSVRTQLEMMRQRILS